MIGLLFLAIALAVVIIYAAWMQRLAQETMDELNFMAKRYEELTNAYGEALERLEFERVLRRAQLQDTSQLLAEDPADWWKK